MTQRIKIGHDTDKERAFNERAQYKRTAFLSILTHLRGFVGIDIPPSKFNNLKNEFLKAIKTKYENQYPGVKDATLFELLSVNVNELIELEENYNRYSLELDEHGNPAEYPDFSIYAETENEIMTFNALENILSALKVLKQNNRMILIGELNNSLFGAYQIDLTTNTICPRPEFIKNVNFQMRQGNPRLKM